MAFSNYGELKTAVATWLSRTDQTSNIPDFIRLAHSVICRHVQIPLTLTATTISVSTAGAGALPTGFRAMERAWVAAANNAALKPTSLQEITLLMQGPSATGTPAAYAIQGASLVVWPLPAATTTLNIVYRAEPALLVNDADTNLILTRYPALYLYGACAEASRLLQDDEALNRWGGSFDRMVQDINAAELADQFAGGTLRVTSSGTVV